jgi:hypothetical protein
MVQPLVRKRKLPMSQLLLERGEVRSFFCNPREKRHGPGLASAQRQHADCVGARSKHGGEQRDAQP